MHVRSIVAVATPFLLSALTLGCSPMVPPSAASPTNAAAAAEPPKAPGHVYRLDFALSPGGAYSLTLEEQRNGEIRVGTNIPLSTTAPAPRQDVGLNLHTSFATIGDDLLLHTNLEMSSVDEPGAGPVAIHRLSAAGDALVSPGKPALINSIEDPTGHKHYQLTVTATKLR
jgi:hypothetical protein